MAKVQQVSSDPEYRGVNLPTMWQPTPEESSSVTRTTRSGMSSFRQRLMREASEVEQTPAPIQPPRNNKGFFEDLAATFVTTPADRLVVQEPKATSTSSGPAVEQDHPLVKELQGILLSFQLDLSCGVLQASTTIFSWACI